MRRACITGGAGFIGCNLADRLQVGRRRGRDRRRLPHRPPGVPRELLDGRASIRVRGRRPRPGAARARVATAATGCSIFRPMQMSVTGSTIRRRDLEQNTIATVDGARGDARRRVTQDRLLLDRLGLRRAERLPDPRGRPVPDPDFAVRGVEAGRRGADLAPTRTGYGFTGSIFRFVSILGERYTHGHVFDFYRALKHDPSRLRVLGDGRQEKSYLYVQDCVSAILAAAHAARARKTGRSRLQPRDR